MCRFSFKVKHAVQCRKFWSLSEQINKFPRISMLQSFSNTVWYRGLIKYDEQSRILCTDIYNSEMRPTNESQFWLFSYHNMISKQKPTSSRSFLVLSSSALISSIVIPNQLSVQQKTCLWKFVKILLSAFENKNNARKLEWSSRKGTKL